MDAADQDEDFYITFIITNMAMKFFFLLDHVYYQICNVTFGIESYLIK